jgi:hypothetical protein
MRPHAIRPRRGHDFVSSNFDYDLHAKRVRSLADATVGALQGAQLAVGALGRALAVAKDLDPKHAIKAKARPRVVPPARALAEPSREGPESMK